MSTAYDKFYSAFFDKIQNNSEFFNYYNLTDVESLSLAKQRAKGYLKESIAKLTSKCTPDVNFRDCDDVLEVINVDATDTEIDLIANLMFEMFLAKDIAKLTAFSPHFTASELKTVLSPASERTSFLSMFKSVQENNIDMIDDYKGRDRLTGQLKMLNFPL